MYPPPAVPPCCHGSTEAEPPLAERAEAAHTPLPGGARPDSRAARPLASAVAKLAAADFAVLAAEGSEDSYIAAAEIGDAMRASRAQEAAGSVLEVQREIGSIGWFEIKAAWESYGESLASGDSDGEEGQRLLIAIAEKLYARLRH